MDKTKKLHLETKDMKCNPSGEILSPTCTEVETMNFPNNLPSNDNTSEKQTRLVAKPVDFEGKTNDFKTTHPNPFLETKCAACNKTFFNTYFLERHIRMSADCAEATETTCAICNTNFPDNDYLKRHFLMAPNCGRAIESKLSKTKKEPISTTTFRLSNETPPPCTFCNKMFTTASYLEKHIESMHIFPCEHCDEIFLSKPLLMSHLTELDIYRKCDECYELINKDEMKDHKIRKHFEQMDLDGTFEWDKAIPVDESLDSETTEEHPILPVVNGDTIFGTQTSLDVKHDMVESEFQCDACGKVYGTPFLLNNQKHFKCGTCGLISSTQRVFNSHKLQHRAQVKSTLPKTKSDGEIVEHDIGQPSIDCDQTQNLLDTDKVDPDIGQPSIDCDQTQNLLDTDKITCQPQITSYFMCDTCGEILETQNLLDTHKVEHDKVENGFKCDKCGKKFGTQLLLVKHKLTYSGNYFRCEFCDIAFTKHDNLTKHMDGQHSFKCLHCAQLFPLIKLLIEHMKSAHLKKIKRKIYHCDTCGKNFSAQYFLDNHKVRYHTRSNLPMLNCNTCDKSFGTKLLLYRHKLKECTFKCNICDIDFTSQDYLTLHLTTQHSHTSQQSVSFKCNTCDESFQTQNLLDTHKVKHQTHTSQPPTVESEFQCDRCGMSFPTIFLLHTHKHFICDTCGKQFLNQDLLDKHKLNQCSQFFKCEICDIDFTKQDALTKHIADEHSFTCSYCDQPFSLKKLLIEHMASAHPKERTTKNEKRKKIKDPPLKCEFCGMNFDTKSKFEKHIRYENSVRESNINDEEEKSGVFRCVSCGRKFCGKDKLVKHIFSKHKWKCGHCIAVFESKLLLSQHKSSKHGGKGNFKCNYCNHTYLRRFYLMKHIAERHPVEHNRLIEQSESSEDQCSDFEISDFQCHKCSKGFKSFEELECHSKVHILEDQENEIVDVVSVYCDVCEATFDSVEDLEKHSKEHIKVEDDIL